MGKGLVALLSHSGGSKEELVLVPFGLWPCSRQRTHDTGSQLIKSVPTKLLPTAADTHRGPAMFGRAASDTDISEQRSVLSRGDSMPLRDWL